MIKDVLIMDIGAAMFVISVCGTAYLTAESNAEMSKSGLQQCVVQGKIIWQRECGK